MIGDKSQKELTYLSHGISSRVARKLLANGTSFTSAASMPAKALKALGINDAQIAILHERRPPIPLPTVIKLLSDSRSLCCICRTKKPIIIHHIEEWSISRSHDEDNLVVLCTEHHDEAHTRHENSMNLTPSRIRELKKEWMSKVLGMDRKAVSGLVSSESSRWHYFNHLRIFELCRQCDISLPIYSYPELRGWNMIDKSGNINSVERWKIKHIPSCHLYNSGEGRLLYFYMSDIANELFSHIDLTKLDEIWSLTELNALLEIGKFVYFTGACYFKTGKQDTGVGQLRIGYRQKDGIRLDFAFDAWECTSTSSWGYMLRGRSVNTCMCQITGIQSTEKYYRVQCSVLAIGSNFQ